MKNILLLFLTTLTINAYSYSEELVKKVNYAAKTNNIELINEYIRLNGNLDIQDSKGYTPLIYAAYYGHNKLVNVLLKHKANPCLKDKRGNTALMGAIFKGNISIAYKLMNSKCVINQKNNANQTALMYASLFGRKEIAKKLLDKGESALEKDQNGFNAIEVAKRQHNTEMLKLLKRDKKSP